MEVNHEKNWYILQFFFHIYENASQVAEIENGVYSADTVIANYVQFWFRRFHLGIFDVKDTSHTGRPTFKNVDKITEIIEVDRHVSRRRTAQERNMMGQIFICEALAKSNEIDPFLKRMVTGEENWVTYDNIVRK
ncbi:histone-lysine N-methyltransferase SETMAR [Trichonephila clavipes]|nr:histone-lysine N-methyltransferase SETMAR [Trichonephila clavipes]